MVTQEKISKQADKLADTFIQGNRNEVCQEIAALGGLRAAALTLAISKALHGGDRESFHHAIFYRL